MRKFNGNKAGIICGVALASFTSYALLDTFVIPHPMQTVSGQNLEANGLSLNEDSESTEVQNAYADGENQEQNSYAEWKNQNQNSYADRENQEQNTFSQEDTSSDGFTQKHEDTENIDNGDENSSNQSFGSSSGTTSSASGASSSASGTVIGTYSDSKSKITLTQYRAYNSNIYVADVEVTEGTSILSAFANNTYGRNITDTTSNMAEENNAVLAINGDYYGARQSGYVIRNGVVYRNQGSNGEDMVISKDGTLSFISESDTDTDSLIQNQAWQVLSFGPALVENGQIAVTENDEVGRAMASNPRTAIGTVAKNHYLFVVSDGRTSESAGLSLYELANFMKSLGATNVYNLDGGGSSTMVFRGEVVNNPTTNGNRISERAVSDILYIGKSS